MAVFVTGDIHGNPTRLSKDSFYEQKDFSGNKDENLVILVLYGTEMVKANRKNIG